MNKSRRFESKISSQRSVCVLFVRFVFHACVFASLIEFVYSKLVPLIRQANLLAQDLKRPVTFTGKLKSRFGSVSEAEASAPCGLFFFHHPLLRTQFFLLLYRHQWWRWIASGPTHLHTGILILSKSGTHRWKPCTRLCVEPIETMRFVF